MHSQGSEVERRWFMTTLRYRRPLGVTVAVLVLLTLSAGTASARYGGRDAPGPLPEDAEAMAGAGDRGGGWPDGTGPGEHGDDSDSPETRPGEARRDEHARKPEGETGHKPDNPGSGRPTNPGTGLGTDYADLVVALRDVNGLPILDEAGCVRAVSDVQILPANEGDTILSTANPVDGRVVWLVPLYSDLGLSDAELEALEVEPCDILGGEDSAYAGYVQETELGRLNIGRSPESVLDKQLADVVTTLGGAANLGLDWAGRLVANPGTETEKTIDSPLQNLAIHVELLQAGTVGGVDVVSRVNGGYFGETNPMRWGPMQHAAVGLAAASDKGGEVNVDVVQYMGRILGTAEGMVATLTGGTSCSPPTELVGATAFDGGVVCGVPGEEYVDFRAFSYNRQSTFPGCVTYWDMTGEQPAKVTSTILEAVGRTAATTGGNIAGFAKHADDARAVNLWFHDLGALVISYDTVGFGTHCPIG